MHLLITIRMTFSWFYMVAIDARIKCLASLILFWLLRDGNRIIHTTIYWILLTSDFFFWKYLVFRGIETHDHDMTFFKNIFEKTYLLSWDFRCQLYAQHVYKLFFCFRLLWKELRIVLKLHETRFWKQLMIWKAKLWLNATLNK